MHFKAGPALALLLTLAFAGCGGAGGDEDGGVASAGGAPSASSGAGAGGKEAGLRYAQCMRENGVPNFPDPEVSDGGQVSYDVPDDIPDSVINEAEEKCREHRPFGPGSGGPDPRQIEQMREHSQCVRENRIPNFPDPEDDGSTRIDPSKLGLSGMDDPKLNAAEEKCREFRPDAPPGAVAGGNG